MKKDLIKQKFHNRCNGYIEVYKTNSYANKEKRLLTYEHVLTKQMGDVSKGRYDPTSVFFGAFLCLMLRYTQKNYISGICIQNIKNKILLYSSDIEYNNKTNFANIMKWISKEDFEIPFNKKNFDSLLFDVKNYTNCLFLYTDSLDAVVSLDNIRLYNDIYVQIIQGKEKLLLNITYNENAYSEDFIKRMGAHYENLLSFLRKHFEIPIYKIDYLEKQEKNLLVHKWNDTEHDFPRGYCIHQLFERQVRKDPNAIAVCYDDRMMNREELNLHANQVAHSLLRMGVSSGEVVAVYANKTIDYIVSVLGVLKAGCAYLPIDASYPIARVEYLLTKSDVSIVVDTTGADETIQILSEYNVIKVNIKQGTFLSVENCNPEVDVSPKDPCYLIFTSGSTGSPKAILLNHEGRVNNFYDFNSRFSISSTDAILSVSSVSFDMSAYDILGSLMSGARIVLPNIGMEKQPFHWMDLIRKYNVTLWHSVPVLLEILCKCYEHRKQYNADSIRLVLLGGDWIPVTLPDEFRRLNKDSKIVSLGGATEVSMDSVIYVINEVKKEWRSIPYGKPMYNQKTYVLDENMQLMPIGLPGELYIGGVGVADGYYLNQTETDNYFFQNMWMDDCRERIYKTGDLAFYESDGTLILLGRRDFQVKINGIRIELAEVEKNILQFEGIKRVVAVAPMIGNKRKIVTYAECDTKAKDIYEKELFVFLSSRLPKGYIPSEIIFVESIPTTPNGKIDRKKIEKMAFDFINKEKNNCTN